MALALTAPAPIDNDKRETPVVESGTSTDVPSARPTSIPDYDFEAFADASVRHPPPGMPLDLAIPVRAGFPGEGSVDLRTAFVFFHIDGRSSILEIAQYAELSIPETVGCILTLLAQGVVELMGPESRRASPVSGVFPRMSTSEAP